MYRLYFEKMQQLNNNKINTKAALNTTFNLYEK